MDMHKFVGGVVAAIHRLAVLLGVRQELPVHPFTGVRAIGVLPSGRPVWPVLGGAPEEDEDEEGDEGEAAGEDGQDEGQEEGEAEEESEGDADGEEAEEGKKPAKKKAEETVSRSELTKAIKARQDAKAQLREAKAELAKLKQENETSAEKAAREAREAAEAAAEKRYKPIAIRAALLEAGVKSAKVKGALKLLEMADIEVDGDGEVTGLDDQLDGLKEEWPELFASPESEGGGERERRRASVGSRSVDGADKERKKRPLTASERQAAQLLGKR